MFGFPVNLQDSGIQKFTNDADNGFPKIQKREIFYSVKDGNWLDATIWQTASGRVGMIPGANDDVYIKNVVLISTLHPLYGADYYCNNLFISGTFNYYNFRLNVYGNFKNVGVVNSGLGTGFFTELKLYGVENVLGTINQNNWTNIHFARNGVQYIPPYNYYRLTTSGLGAKYLTSNTIVLNNLICADSSPSAYIGGIVNSSDDKLPIFECAGYELEVYGQTLVNQWCIFKQSGSGRLKFRGLLGVGYGLQYPGGLLLPGNPDVECQNGFYISYDTNLGYGTRGGFYSGLGTWRFTTNNQTIGTNVPSTTILTLDCPILIDSGITLTFASPFSAPNSAAYLNNTINGVSSTSKLENKSNLYFNTAASVPSMTTGIFDFTTFANTIGFTGNYTATIPTYFSTFHNLTIAGTGTKSLGVNTTINSNLTLTNNTSATLQCSSYNLVVLGNTNIASNLLAKNSNIGTITFNGLVSMGNGEGFNFSGNPNVEFKNGLNCTNVGGTNTNTGTGIWKFSTNNQLFTTAGACFTNINSSILIDGITLTMNQTYGNFTLYINNTIDGTNSSSNLILNAPSFIYLTLAFNNISNATLMPTFGTADVSTGSIQYSFNNNFTLPYTTYGKLVIGGTGIKTLNGNTTIGAGGLSYIQNTSGYLECSTFNLTINGNTNVPSLSTLSKNAGGNITFVGQLAASTSDPSGSPSTINFSGNPNVEFRNGIKIVNAGGGFTTGTGTFTFTTNNQNIDTNSPPLFNCNMIVNNIVLSHTCSEGNFVTMTINGTLDGFNSASTFRMGTGNGTPSINYRNATQPMATGILDTFTNLNTWIYGNANQDIKGGPTTGAKQVYRNLTLNGGGTKTLQGYVSVLNTYTLTSPATLNNNGFTLTNP